MFSKWLGLLVFWFVTAVIFVQGHNHEAPHLKYSREVNEQEVAREKVHSHVHDHEHDHAGCGNDHGHKHAHDHHHDHTHDHHQDHNSVISDLLDQYHYKFAVDEKFVPYAADSYLSFLNDPTARLWTYAIASVLLISAFPCFVLAFIPIQANTSKNSFFLKILLAFGAGGLLGDAFLHLIPHASGGHDHGHSHDHGHDHHHRHSHDEEDHDHVHDMSTGFWVLGGLLTFFIVEKFVRIVRGEDNHYHGHTHVHSHSPNTKKKNLKLQGEESDDEKSEASVKKDKVLKNRPTKKEGEKKKVTPVEVAILETPRIRVAAYLNLAADFMHNFTDGLAIGASFIAGTAVGLVTTATVLFHEVPHEIGDFAILVQSGYSKKRAMFTQLLTALGALLGCVISLWSVDAAALAEAAQSSWVLPFTAGGFIYIATVSVIPELLEKSSLLLSILEVVALSAGVFAMYVVALFE